MNYKLKHMSPKDHFDASITVEQTPNWYNFSAETDYKRYYGSGTTWWEADTDRRVDVWTSGILHDLWNDELNKQLQEKNTKKYK